MKTTTAIMAGAAVKRVRAERKNRVTELALRASGALAAYIRETPFVRTGMLTAATAVMGAGWFCLGAGLHALGLTLMVVAAALARISAESFPNY